MTNVHAIKSTKNDPWRWERLSYLVRLLDDFQAENASASYDLRCGISSLPLAKTQTSPSFANEDFKLHRQEVRIVQSTEALCLQAKPHREAVCARKR